MGEDIKGKFKKFNKEFKDYCASKKSPAILLAVSKTKPLSQIVDLFEEGQKAFGENYAQELRDKDRENLNTTAKNLVWHFIGQIQKNKIKYIVGPTALIHTVDTYEKAVLINSLCEQRKIKQSILLQVNISNDKNKAGIKKEDTKSLIKKIKTLEKIQLKGLMTITEFSDNPEKSRPFYKNLRLLATELKEEFLCSPELSMGMSGDYRVAIDEGATIVRIGSKIFGERKKTL